MQSSSGNQVEKFGNSRKKNRKENGNDRDNRKRDKVVRGKNRDYDEDSN